jgi:protein CrcB
VLSFVWIGLGGALGSMARAWLAIAVARVTGPQFPWGTILINVLGSFIIGFFGTLTATDGRFSVPTDLRAFVMVGICGGFTTFSSFSLQTLDLARDGRVAQALGNIGLSVALCLLSVAAGHYSAAGLHRGHRSAAMTGGEGMGEVVVAVLNRPDEANGLLRAAVDLLDIGGGGLLKALTVRLPPMATILPSEEVLTADRTEAIRAEQQHWASELKELVDDWSVRVRERGIRTDRVDPEGDAAEIVAEQGRRADAIVVASPADHTGERTRHSVHAALFETGCPVLVVPPGFVGSFGRVVAIAWKEDDRAVKAVRAALPILRKADRVHVLSAHRPAVLPAVLAEHGIAATLHTVPEGEGSVSDRLLATAHAVGADLLVMGAFAHGEWREMLFGGVTRSMLAKADLPLLMRH